MVSNGIHHRRTTSQKKQQQQQQQQKDESMLWLMLSADASQLNRFFQASPRQFYSHHHQNFHRRGRPPQARSSHASTPFHFIFFQKQNQYRPSFIIVTNPSSNRSSRRVRGGGFSTRAGAGGESPYQVLGVSPSATPLDIKRAYRKLALKYHPDVNKDPGAQQQFMRIKHAYSTLIDSKSPRPKGYSDYSHSQTNPSATNPQDEEDFYGLADFFRDVQEEFRNWEASSSSQGKPKSLWEELSEIGEEFVEFLEKELDITDSGDKAEFNRKDSQKDNIGADSVRSNMSNEDGKKGSIEDNIEATLAQLKKELGL